MGPRRDWATSVFRSSKIERREPAIETADLEYDGYRDLLHGTGSDAVVVVPDYHGFTPYATREAAGFAGEGRMGVLLDLYGNRALPRTGGDAFARIQPMMLDRGLGLSRLEACVRQLREAGVRRVVLVGYSCGGSMVLDAVRTGADVDGVISIWGLLQPMSPLPQVMRSVPDRKVPTLVIQGGLDDLAPPATYAAFADEMRAIGVDWQFHLMGTAKHAFTLREDDNVEVQSGEHPELLLYDADADRRSRSLVGDFLDETLS